MSARSCIRTADSWDLDLVIEVNASRSRAVISGALMGGSAVIALVPQHLSTGMKVGLGIAAVALGIVSNLIASAKSSNKQ
jgi:hypothetical protein